MVLPTQIRCAFKPNFNFPKEENFKRRSKLVEVTKRLKRTLKGTKTWTLSMATSFMIKTSSLPHLTITKLLRWPVLLELLIFTNFKIFASNAARNIFTWIDFLNESHLKPARTLSIFLQTELVWPGMQSCFDWKTNRKRPTAFVAVLRNSHSARTARKGKFQEVTTSKWEGNRKWSDFNLKLTNLSLPIEFTQLQVLSYA